MAASGLQSVLSTRVQLSLPDSWDITRINVWWYHRSC